MHERTFRLDPVPEVLVDHILHHGDEQGLFICIPALRLVSGRA
jgi:hypothetical protein